MQKNESYETCNIAPTTTTPLGQTRLIYVFTSPIVDFTIDTLTVQALFLWKIPKYNVHSTAEPHADQINLNNLFATNNGRVERLVFFRANLMDLVELPRAELPLHSAL